MSEQFLQRAHPFEVALAKNELDLFADMSDVEKTSFLVRSARGSNVDIVLGVVSLVGLYGTGKVVQSWFPYTYAGNMPVIPTILGLAGGAVGFLAKRRLGFRLPLIMGATGMLLGGNSISGAKL